MRLQKLSMKGLLSRRRIVARGSDKRSFVEVGIQIQDESRHCLFGKAEARHEGRLFYVNGFREREK